MTIPSTPFVPFAAVFNFRAVSGFTSRYGGTLRPGLLYRSDTLSRLGDPDRPAYEPLGVRTVIDLRRPEEVSVGGRAPEWAAPAYFHRHLRHPYWRHEDYTERIGVARYLADRYGELARSGAADIAGVVELVADPETGPVAVHCVAGKDRTGTVVAFVLDLLGVDEDEIAHEYALTELTENAFATWARTNIPGFAAKAPVPYYVSTPPEAMATALREIRAEFGSVEKLLTGAGLAAGTTDRLRAKFLA
ncbi:tyrosine-protein phosphatase [Hamadaea tsunoensis]|uniref:tyrosine-protein phosphatase n=1 Tax=Hamadaea tsunoensis TaxID=53368 RepID=UPI00041B3D6F|nr:tyrosine-protein phosphatase [Hamadaea tsunoensis]